MRYLVSLLVFLIAFVAYAARDRGAVDTGPFIAGTECIELMARDINSEAARAVELTEDTGALFDFSVAKFNFETADEYGTWEFQVPESIIGTTAVVTIRWQSANALCNGSALDDVCFVVQTGSFGENDKVSFSVLTGAALGVTDLCGAIDEQEITPAMTITHGLTAGEFGILQLHREIDGIFDDAVDNCSQSGDDDLGADAEVISLKLCYEVRTPLSGE